jgi:hypothetical protein
MFLITGSQALLTNLEIIGAPDGIHIANGDGNTLDGVVYKKICEDAVTIGGWQYPLPTNAVIRNSRFENGSDKAIQVNAGDVWVVNNRFKKVGKAVGTGTGNLTTATKNVRFDDNRVEGCNIAVRVAGKGSAGTVMSGSNNSIKKCSTGFLAAEDGEMNLKKNKISSSCKVGLQAEGRGYIKGSGNKISCKQKTKTSGNGKIDI